MNRRKTYRLLWIIIPLLAVLLWTSGAANTSAASSDWSVVPSINPSTRNNPLNAVAALSPTNVWAVGFAGDFPLIEHWNGSSWKVVVNPGPSGGSLNGIFAVSKNDIWAVGSVFSYSSPRQTLIEHWNGNAWKVIPSPAAGTLNAVTAAAPNEVWAVGFNQNAATNMNQVVIEHWEGKGWKIVPGANPGTGDNILNDVTAITAHDVWTVGLSTTAVPRSGVSPRTVPNPTYQTLVEHWNGTKWQAVKSPNPASATNWLRAVAAVSSNNVWAVGQQAPRGEMPEQTLIEHWNGKAWSVVPSPNVGAAGGNLIGIAVVNKDNIWAVGVSSTGFTSFSWKTLIEHWNGRSWQIDPSPNVGPSGSILYGVACIPHTEKLWAVGAYNTTSAFLRTLTMYSD